MDELKECGVTFKGESLENIYRLSKLTNKSSITDFILGAINSKVWMLQQQLNGQLIISIPKDIWNQLCEDPNWKEKLDTVAIQEVVDYVKDNKDQLKKFFAANSEEDS